MKREPLIAATLEVLLGMGFERARYYEATHEFPGGADVAVLTAQLPEGSHDTLLGEPFDFSTSSWMAAGEPYRPVVGEPAHEASEDPAWVETLGLSEKVWVEIPVLANRRAIGVIALDWTGEIDDLDADDLDALLMVGTQLGAHLGSKPITMLRYYRDGGDDDLPANPGQVVTESANRLAEMLDVAATSVFAYSWPHQTLTKVSEYIAEPFADRRSRMKDLLETYRVGEYLTGHAWQKDEARHVVSFDRLDDASRLVAPESRQWHDELLGEVRSVMYTVVGSLDKRYLLRFINRADRPELPFLAELTVLEDLLPDLRSAVDAVIAAQRAWHLEDTTRLTTQVQAPGESVTKELVDRVGTALEAETVDHFAVVCHQSEAAQFGFSAFCGRQLARDPLPRGMEWEADSLYARAMRNAQGVLRLADYKSDLSTRFREAGFRSVLTMRLFAGQTRGVFFIPMASLPGGGQKGLPAECTPETISLLRAYSRLIANSVETGHSQAMSEGARRALGFLGHELRTPLSIVQSASELSLNTAKRTLRAVPLTPQERVPLLREIGTREQEMREHWQEIDAAMRLSGIVAKESENRLQVHFASNRVSRVVERAVREVEEDLLAQPDREGRRYEFVVADSVDALERVACDRIYLRHVIRNLLQNAVSYSTPRRRRREGHRPEPMVIQIFGERQEGHVAIIVRNWGLGIPDESRDVIFAPWVRGDVSDSRKAIRGMGLGLFLARRIVSAHNGRILCRSDFVASNPSMRARNEGFETTFEVRIPRELPLGTHIHEWVGYRPQPLIKVND